VASEHAAGVARVLTAGPEATALAAHGVVRTRVLVIVAGAVCYDVSTVDDVARVRRHRRRLVQVAFVLHCVPVW